MLRRLIIFIALLAVVSSGAAQGPKQIAVRAGKFIDGKRDQPLSNVLILVEGTKIVSVTPGGSVPAGAGLIFLFLYTLGSRPNYTHTAIFLSVRFSLEPYV